MQTRLVKQIILSSEEATEEVRRVLSSVVDGSDATLSYTADDGVQIEFEFKGSTSGNVLALPYNAMLRKVAAIHGTAAARRAIRSCELMRHGCNRRELTLDEKRMHDLGPNSKYMYLVPVSLL